MDISVINHCPSLATRKFYERYVKSCHMVDKALIENSTSMLPICACIPATIGRFLVKYFLRVTEGGDQNFFPKGGPQSFLHRPRGNTNFSAHADLNMLNMVSE